MGQCEHPSPGGNLQCVREPHGETGHVWLLGEQDHELAQEDS